MKLREDLITAVASERGETEVNVRSLVSAYLEKLEQEREEKRRQKQEEEERLRQEEEERLRQGKGSE